MRRCREVVKTKEREEMEKEDSNGGKGEKKIED